MMMLQMKNTIDFITGYGFKMGGDEKTLISKFKASNNIDEKMDILFSMKKFKSISEDTKNTLVKAYKEEKGSKVQIVILELLLKYNDARSRDLIKDSLQGENKN